MQTDLFGNPAEYPTQPTPFDPLAGEEPGEWRVLYDDDGIWKFYRIASGYWADPEDGAYRDLDLDIAEIIFMPNQVGELSYESATPYVVETASYDVQSYEVGPKWIAKIHGVVQSCGWESARPAPLPEDMQEYFDSYRDWRTWHGTARLDEPAKLAEWEKSMRIWFSAPYFMRAEMLYSYQGGDVEGEYENLGEAMTWGAYVPTSLVDDTELEDVPLYGQDVKSCKRCEHPLVHPAHVASHRDAHREALEYDRADILARWTRRHDPK